MFKKLEIGTFFSQRGILNWLLLPLSWLYCVGFFMAFYLSKFLTKRATCPVICVGNVLVGGVGKTPVSLAIAKILQKDGKRVAFLSRGYGGTLSSYHKVVKVNTAQHLASSVGDEPILLSEVAPTYICTDRYKAAEEAMQEGSEVLIMDDGMQNNTLYKNYNLLVIDGSYFIGNGLLLPAGPMREPLSHALRRTDMVIIVGSTEQNYRIANLLKRHNFEGVVSYATAHIAMPAIVRDLGKCLLFTGIARPERVLNMLKEFNIRVEQHFSYADHHQFTVGEIEQAISYAKKSSLPIVTTAKDFVKIPIHFRANFLVLEYGVHLDEKEILKRINATVHYTA